MLPSVHIFITSIYLCRCANPYDPNVSTLKASDFPQSGNKRRFMVTAFQFMNHKTNQYLDEEVSQNKKCTYTAEL